MRDAPLHDDAAFREWLRGALAPLPARAQGLFAAACAARLGNAVAQGVAEAERAAFTEVQGLLDEAWRATQQASLDPGRMSERAARADTLADETVDADEHSLVTLFADATESTLSSLARAPPTIFDRLTALFGDTPGTSPAFYASSAVLDLVETLLERSELKDVEEDARFWRHHRTQQELTRQARDVKLLCEEGVPLDTTARRLRGFAEREAA